MKKSVTQNSDFWSRTIVVFIGACICCFLWGSAFPCIKSGYKMFEIGQNDTASQILFAGVRFTFAGILTIIIGSALQRKILIPKKKSLKNVAVLALFQTVLQYYFFYVGLANTTGVKSSIINGTNVFTVILITSLVFKMEKLEARKMLGCLIGFIGLVIVNLNGGALELGFTLRGEGFVFFSSIAYGFSSAFMKKSSKNENPVVLSGYQFIVGGIVMVIMGILLGGQMHLKGASGIVLMFYMACISAVAYSLWGILLKYNPASNVAVFGFTNPIFGVLLSAIFLKEFSSLNIYVLIALILVSIGIYIVNRNEIKRI